MQIARAAACEISLSRHRETGLRCLSWVAWQRFAGTPRKQ